MMQWPDNKSDGVMIDGIMLESEMSPVGSVWGAAEPVLLAAKSEVFTPVVFAGGVVAAAAPLAVVEAVTARVSVLPVVGSELPTGLSAAVGVTEQLVVDLGDTLDKVGHGAGGTSNPDDRQIGRYDDSDWSRKNPNLAFGKEVSRTGMTCAEYCPYIKLTSLNEWAVSNRPAVEPIVLRSPHRLGRDARDEDITWIRLTYFWFHNCLVWWIVMSSSKIMPEADRPSAVDTDSTQPPGTFLRHVLKSHSDRLYDLPEDITDVMGLQALRPSAEVCKVMTVPNSCCVRVMTPDEHVITGFHEILIHDMAKEEWPPVSLE